MMRYALLDPVTRQGRLVSEEFLPDDLTGLTVVEVAAEVDWSTWSPDWDNMTLQQDMSGAWASVRIERNERLAACDWTQMPDSPLSEGDVAAWRSYRQQLRDLPETLADPRNPIWPERPDAA